MWEKHNLYNKRHINKRGIYCALSPRSLSPLSFRLILYSQKKTDGVHLSPMRMVNWRHSKCNAIQFISNGNHLFWIEYLWYLWLLFYICLLVVLCVSVFSVSLSYIISLHSSLGFCCSVELYAAHYVDCNTKRWRMKNNCSTGYLLQYNKFIKYESSNEIWLSVNGLPDEGSVQNPEENVQPQCSNTLNNNNNAELHITT